MEDGEERDREGSDRIGGEDREGSDRKGRGRTVKEAPGHVGGGQRRNWQDM